MSTVTKQLVNNNEETTMNMPCHITDLNKWDDEAVDEIQDTKEFFLTDVSIDDLLGKDFDVYVNKNEDGSYNLELEDFNGEMQINETHVADCAIDSLARFCEQFLHFYNKAQKD